MSTNVRGVKSLEQHVALMQVTRSTMTTAIPPRAELGPGVSSGQLNDYRWQIDIGPLGGGWIVPDADVAWIPQLVKHSCAVSLRRCVRSANHSPDAQAPPMKRRSLNKKRNGEGGFTLIETLVALALTGLVLSALANITSQWLPNWNRGIRPHPAQRIDRPCIAAVERRPCSRRICAGQSRATPAAVRWVGVVGDVRANSLGPQCQAGPGSGADRRNNGSPGTGNGPIAGTVRAIGAWIVAVRANSDRRPGCAVARAVSAFVFLCRSRPDLEKQLARCGQAAGGDHADGSRRGDRTRAHALDGGAGSR